MSRHRAKPPGRASDEGARRGRGATPPLVEPAPSEAAGPSKRRRSASRSRRHPRWLSRHPPAG
ncbi:hypothetical protein CYJ73_12995 [Gordonia terrae]|uniref:Uncharacterized protein n=1 Tax=Gordonia terrae TaxID=2055 RepID=A0A2I1R7U1_9ACTN|nr:hypothetical protein CYJ73_12995 [Gordonia terrae]